MKALRRFFEILAIGYTVGAVFFTPPITASEGIAIIVLLVIVAVLDFAADKYS